MKKFLPGSFTALLLLLSIHTFANGHERITRFHSEVIVHKNGSLEVTERITVNATGDRIEHGIFRKLPVIYETRAKTHFRVNYSFEEILLDGKAIPFHVKKENNSKILYLGDKDKLLSHGIHTYTLKYSTRPLILQEEKSDILYWNITGNGWELAMDTITAKIQFPQGAKINQLEVYTGDYGTTGDDFQVTGQGENSAEISTVYYNLPYSGMTVYAGIDKGVITSPTLLSNISGFVSDNPGIAVGISGLLLTSAYYLIAWLIVGKDPKKGKIELLDSPPEGLSPAALRYVMKMESDLKGFSASIMNLAVRGHLKLGIDNHKMAVAARITPDKKSYPEERGIYRAFFSRKKAIMLTRPYRMYTKAALNLYENALEKQFGKQLFRHNRSWMIPGIILSLVSWIAMIASTYIAPEYYGGIIYLSAFMLGTAIGLTLTIDRWKRYKALNKQNKAHTWFITILCAVFLIISLFLLGILVNAIGPWIPIAFALFAALYYLFKYLMKAPSVKGQKLRDEIEGFRRYLVEASTASHLSDNAELLKVYEKYLPYAIALDIEDEWAEKHESQLHKVVKERNYRPAWLYGTIPMANLLGFMMGARLHNGISTGLYTSTTEMPGTGGTGFGGGISGGGGGGGFSGGGFGGGGGGGW